MAQAQTIMNFFTDAIEQNDCSVKMVIGFYTEIQDNVNAVNDLRDAFNQPIYEPDYWKGVKDNTWYPTVTGDTSVTATSLIDSPLIIAEAKAALKNRCFNCRFTLPVYKMSFDIDFMFNKIQIQIQMFRAVFKNNLSFSLCQASFLFQRTCIPDLVRLVGLFLAAYSAILALHKLPKTSLGLFVKSIISTLVAKVIASLNLSIDMSSTGIPCIVNALKEITYNMPTNESLKARIGPEHYAHIDRGYKPVSVMAQEFADAVKEGKMTQEEADLALDDYKSKNDSINFFADKLQANFDFVQDNLDEGLRMITDVVDNAVEDVNSYIDSILGVINFLQCENKRTGTDFSEVIEYANKIQTVLNLISAITAYMAKQFLRSELCKDAKTVDQLKKAIVDAPVPDLTTPSAIREITQEWSGSTVKLDSDGLNLLIYEEPAYQMLPKLTLLGCNFKEFAEAHSLDNIIKEAAKAIQEEDRNNSSPDIQQDNRGQNNFTMYPQDSVYPGTTNIPTSQYEWITVDPYKTSLDESLRPYRDPYNNTIINGKDSKTPGNTGGSDPFTKDPGVINTDTYIPPKDSPSDPNTPKDGDKNTTGNVDVPKDIPDLIDKIPIPSGDPKNNVYKDWIKSIDEVIDFIYNPPFKGDPENTIKDPATNVPVDPDDPYSELSFFKEDLNATQAKYQPSLAECRTVEDVMDILNNLKI